MNIPARIGPNRGSELEFAIKRQLDEADLERILAPGRVDVPVPDRQRMRARHHQLAMLIASGEKPGVAASMMGYAGATVSILQNDPAFKHLVRVYREGAEEKYQTLHKRAAHLGEAVLDEIQSRLDDKAEKFTIHELSELAKNMLGYSVAKSQGGGGGTTGSPVNINIKFVEPSGEPPQKVING